MLSLLIFSITNLTLHFTIISIYDYKYDLPLVLSALLPNTRTINYFVSLYVFSLSLGFIDQQSTISFITIFLYLFKIVFDNYVETLFKNINDILEYLFNILDDLEDELIEILNSENFDSENEMKNENNNKTDEELIKELKKRADELMREYYFLENGIKYEK
jgi:hypothetical protein